MNLPFSPTFFRKMDIYQQLMEYEAQRKEKHLWDGEKAVLIWAGSDQHQHLGTSIDNNHMKQILDYCKDQGFLTDKDVGRLQSQAEQILQSIVVREFAEQTGNPASKYQLRINRDGILAGQILKETKNLKKPWRYRQWTIDWWFAYYAAGILLALGIVKTFLDIIKM